MLGGGARILEIPKGLVNDPRGQAPVSGSQR